MAVSTPAATQPCDIGTQNLESLLDQVLPLRTRPIWKTGARKVTTIRYTPLDTSAGETLLTIVEMDDNSITADVKRIAGGFAHQADDIMSDDTRATCEDLVHRVTTRQKRVTGSRLEQLRRLYKRLVSTSIKADAPAAIYLDTAKYEYFVSGGMADLSVTLFAASEEARRPDSLLRNLREMLRLAEVETLAPTARN